MEKKQAFDSSEKLQELIKPKKVEDIYSETKAVEALCREFGAGTDCRLGNSSIDPSDDDLLF